MSRLFWIIGMAIALVAYLVLMAGYAYGQDLEIPIDTVHRGDPGELFFEGEIEVQAGVECVAVLTWTNNMPDLSEHPDTDILVGPITFFDVERGMNFTATKPFTAIGTVEVYTRLGADGVTSGGGNLEVTCNPPESTTTTITPPSTTIQAPSSSTTSTIVAPTTTTVASTTTEPAPEGGVPAGGGSCADGACDDKGILSPLLTWTAILGIGAFILMTWLLWAVVSATHKGGTEPQ